MREIQQGQFYRHFKDRLYQIVAVAEHSVTGEQMVVYQALYGDYRIYVDSYEMFVSEVDHAKYPMITQRYRFEPVKLPNAQKDTQYAAEENEDRQKSTKAEAAQPPVRTNGCAEGTVNPILLEFLDAETLEEKMHIMVYNRNRMDENLLNSIAISLDLVVEKKNVQEKYDEILNCLSMMKKFECNRFR